MRGSDGVEAEEGGASRSWPRTLPAAARRLSRRERQALLAVLYRADEAKAEHVRARARLVAGSLHLVLESARAIRPSPDPFAEFLQEGVVALAQAVDVFVRSRGEDFPAFVTAWIRDRLERTRRQLVRERLLFVEHEIDQFPDLDAPDPFSMLAHAEEEAQVEPMLKSLPNGEEQVIRLRFGVGVRDEQTREAICRRLRLDQRRVIYLEEHALLTLRRNSRRWREHLSY